MLASQQQVQICICEKPRKDSLQLQVTASVAASIVSVLATNPLDVIKTRIQTEISNKTVVRFKNKSTQSANLNPIGHRSNPLHVFKAIIKDEGLRGLWRGANSGIAHALPSISIYLTCYEQMKSWLDEKTNISTGFIPSVAGGISRFYAVVLTCPLEVVRTRLMASTKAQVELSDSRHISSHRRYTTTFSVLRELAVEGGVRSLWKGMTPMLWRDVPFSTIYWSLAEATRNYLLV
jgi:solute carrier family 25, member 39/40